MGNFWSHRNRNRSISHNARFSKLFSNSVTGPQMRREAAILHAVKLLQNAAGTDATPPNEQ
jgi:hypothetical protein